MMIKKVGTKAEVLENLSTRVSKSVILPLYYFTVRDWRKKHNEILNNISGQFGSQELIVRSSAIFEDGITESNAGKFRSYLKIDGGDRRSLESAIRGVISSFDKEESNQVLVQPMLQKVDWSGVVFTKNLNDGAPYYIVDYDDETGQTDSVTSGRGVHKTIWVHRRCPRDYLRSSRLRAIIEAVVEIEELEKNVALDIEFGLGNDGVVFVFQVRPLTTTNRWRTLFTDVVYDRIESVEAFVRERFRPKSGLFGSSNILGIMPDWNPAEMLGITPSILSTSLYRELITRDVWRRSRERMGYRQLPPEELMVVLGGRPYIDIRCSLNSFLPDGVDFSIGEKVVDTQLQILRDNPHYHDKLEFEVAVTCADFSVEKTLRDRFSGVLRSAERHEFGTQLRELTLKFLKQGQNSALLEADCRLSKLAHSFRRIRVSTNEKEPMGILSQVARNLHDSRECGTLPFAIMARHAFVAEALMRSAVSVGAISSERVSAFKSSIDTVTTEMVRSFQAVYQGRVSVADFLEQYGHLRPGTYEIRSQRYDERSDLFDGESVPEIGESEPFFLSPSERVMINRELSAAKFDNVTADELFEYARRVIKGREYGKFVFTRGLSDALSGLTKWGSLSGISVDMLALIDLKDIMATTREPVWSDFRLHFLAKAEEGEKLMELARVLKLGYLVRDVGDIYVAPVQRSAPNFVGTGRYVGKVVEVGLSASLNVKMSGKVVCIENADPGFDWIFTRGIAGLITKYGGANSHMAIRCAEFSMPAAIGCGEQLYAGVVAAGAVEMDVGSSTVRPVYGQ